jgi:hypothetical protein
VIFQKSVGRGAELSLATINFDLQDENLNEVKDKCISKLLVKIASRYLNQNLSYSRVLDLLIKITISLEIVHYFYFSQANISDNLKKL